MSAWVVAANDFVAGNALAVEESGISHRLQLGVAAEGEEGGSLPALHACAPEMAHEMELDKMTYSFVRPTQLDVPALVMAMEPGRRTYFHVAWAQVDDPPCTLGTAHAKEPGTYYHVKSL
jgi:hypothetical protein